MFPLGFQDTRLFSFYLTACSFLVSYANVFSSSVFSFSCFSSEELWNPLTLHLLCLYSLLWWLHSLTLSRHLRLTIAKAQLQSITHLNSRFLHPAAYSISSLQCLIGVSSIAGSKPKLLLSLPPKSALPSGFSLVCC